MNDEDVIKLPLTKKPEQSDEKLFSVVRGMKCWHSNFLVDEKLDHVECGKCGEHLNPMYVLQQLANSETREHELLMNRKLQLKDASSKLKWKCGHCDKFNDMSKPYKWRAIK